MRETFSDIVYFCPWISSTNDDSTLKEELKSINRVVDTLKSLANIDVETAPSWAKLISVIQDPGRDNLLVVFRLDFLKREHMMLGEVLSMLGSMTKFVSDSKTVNIAVVVPGVCNPDLIAELKRNEVLGIIPGMRFFDPQHSVEAYENLRRGQSHWPSVAIATAMKRYVRKKRGVDLTKRQYEIFNLIAKRGLSNKKIADILKISEYTVKIHVSAILRLYGVKNRTQLALANETGVIK
jgi:DNA-binding NarL/FixJ family response regulator